MHSILKSSGRVGRGVYKGFYIMPPPPAWAPQNLFNHDIGLFMCYHLQPAFGE